MPRVSVLLTCYNHLAFLPQALESVLKQTFSDFEVLIIDDVSTDGTREWLANSLPDDPRIRVILNATNLGTYATLNVGLEQATGDFIAILNDDDLWASAKLERQLKLFDDHPEVGLVHTEGWFIDGDGRQMAGSPLGFEFPRTKTGDVLLALIYANKIIASAALVRVECFRKVGPFDVGYFGSGDWDMWLRIAEHYAVGYVDEPLTFYRVHGANASHKLDRIWRDDQILRERIVDKMPDYAKKGYPPAAFRRAMAHNWACLGTVRTLNGAASAGRQAYWKSLQLQPKRWKSLARYVATFLPAKLFRKLL